MKPRMTMDEAIDHVRVIGRRHDCEMIDVGPMLLDLIDTGYKLGLAEALRVSAGLSRECADGLDANAERIETKQMMEKMP